MERRNPFKRPRMELEPRPPLRRLWPTTVDVDCESGGRGQLRPCLTRSTSTGHVYREVVKVSPSLTLGDQATHTTECRGEF